jgi:glycerol-3-phosphate O-acyltransferase
MFRLMGNKSKVKTHYFPLAMVSYDLCPPPDFVDPGVGEQRNVRFVPVGIKCGEEVISEGGLDRRQEFCEQAMQTCLDDYKELLLALS